MSLQCDVWRNVMKVWKAFNVNIAFKVGDGNRDSFGGQKWCEDVVLNHDFSILYRASC